MCAESRQGLGRVSDIARPRYRGEGDEQSSRMPGESKVSEEETSSKSCVGDASFKSCIVLGWRLKRCPG